MNAAHERQFLYAHLQAQGGGWQALHQQLLASLEGWQEARRMGCFFGLFGIDNQSVLLLLSLPPGLDAPAELARRLPEDVRILDALALRATVRPLTDAPLTRAGVHVFRFFDVQDSDVAEVARLSDEAWNSFEKGDDYRTEPMGLFRFANPGAGRGRMLLLTWYDSMASWERSRTPHPDATANFQRRARLSRSIIAYATRLCP